jgi:hypothetical protein
MNYLLYFKNNLIQTQKQLSKLEENIKLFYYRQHLLVTELFITNTKISKFKEYQIIYCKHIY